MKIEPDSFSETLIKKNLLTAEIVVKAIQAAKAHKTSFITYVLKEKLIPAAILAELIAQKFDMPIFDLSSFNITCIPINLINEKIIRTHYVLPLWQEQEQLHLAIVDPTNQIALDEIKFFTGLKIKLILVVADALNELIEKVLAEKQNEKFNKLKHEIINEEVTIPLDKKNITNYEEDDAPIIKYVHKILLDAIQQRASDIHFEPYEHKFQIRFRVDGLLHIFASLPTSLISRINTRLKIVADLDIAERRVPQDGRFKINLPENKIVDFRVNTCPTLFGEKIVLRILRANNHLLAVNSLGLTKEQQDILLNMLKKPQGMILVTGPTGSGKTLTLYTLLNMLNDHTVNICTVEDPVEIHLAGINQVNVNPKISLTFANVLRAFLRQDPDVIMVGEMRDLETAEIGIKAAQTGHLVLATVHSNSAAETLTRLLQMGVATYNLASALNLIVAQRLVRKLCAHCKQEVTIPTSTLLTLGFTEQDLLSLKLYGPMGCQICTNGYHGRIGIFELLPITEAITNLIAQKSSAIDIARQAYREGRIKLRDVAIEKVKQGVTSLAEISRVINV